MNKEKMLQLFCQVLQNPIPGALLVEQFEQLTQSEWGQLSALAERHGLTPILYHRIKSLADKLGIPEDLQNHWHQTYVKLVARNLRMMTHTAQALRGLKAYGLEVIGLKGIYLLDNVYENVGLRSLMDVDLLVKKQDLASVIACLQDLGYQRTAWFDPQDENRDIMHVPPLKNKDGLMFELHWTISLDEDPFTFNINTFWQRAVPAKIAGVEVLALNTEDLILHLCFHTSYHHVFLSGLRDLYDIREVIQQCQDQIDWAALVRHAEAAGAERMIGLIFSLLERVLAYKVPDPSAERLSEMVEPDVLNQALSLLFYQPQVSYQVRTEHIAKFLSAKGVKDRFRLVLNRFLMPKQEMARMYNVDPNSLRIFWYYPFRVVKFIASNPGVVKGLLKRGVTGQEVSQSSEEFLNHYNQQLQLREWMTRQ